SSDRSDHVTIIIKHSTSRKLILLSRVDGLIGYLLDGERWRLFQRKRDRFKACLYGRGQAFYSKPALRSYAVHVRRCSIGVHGCCRRGGRSVACLCEKRLAVCLRCVEGNQTPSTSERKNHKDIANRRPRR